MDPFLFFIGILILVAGLYGIISDYHYSKHGFHTEGKVTEIIGKWSASAGNLSYMYFPIVQFKTKDNRDLALRLEVGAIFPLYRKGQSVKIIYYQDQIHPTGRGWTIFYYSLAIIGITITLYQIFELADSEFGEGLKLIWHMLKSIL